MEQNKIYVFHNTKGGTLKTTLCVNVAGVLAKQNKKVLIIDFDPQGNTLQSFGYNSNTIKESIYDYFYGETQIKDLIINTDVEGLDLLPSNKDMRTIDIMWGAKTPKRNFKGLLRDLKGKYEYILIDTTPNLSITTLLSLYEATNVIVPFVADSYGVKSVNDIVEEITSTIKTKNKKLSGVLLVPTKYVSNSTPQNEILDQLKKLYKNNTLINLSNNRIRRSVLFQNSILHYQRPATLTKSGRTKAIKSIFDITKEIGGKK